MRIFFLAASLATFSAAAQLARHVDPELVQQLYQHERYLSSDQLAGRLPGTEGADQASTYIQETFQKLGLRPLFDDRFTQEVKIPEAAKVSPASNYLVVGKDSLRLQHAFWPSIWSGNGRGAGSMRWLGYGVAGTEPNDWSRVQPGAIAVMYRDLPKELATQAGRSGSLAARIAEAERRGFQAVILLVPTKGKPKVDLLRRTRPTALPVVEVYDIKLAKKLTKRAKKGAQARVGTQIVPQFATSNNVGALIDRGQMRTIIIGAHYDHVGLGLWGSRKPELAGQVHNGADDNASGTSVVLALAQILSKVQSLGDANIAFVAFTGEESGLLGSKHFVETIPGNLGKVTTMLNLDMVGRLNRSDSLRVYGTHSGYEFRQMLEQIPADGFYWDLRDEVFGRSDHAPFIQKGIPAVFFFTGLHEDYHAPSDDFERIDVEGMAAVTQAAADFIQLLANNLPPNFNPESKQN